MPSINISNEQAAALARGEDITVAAPKPAWMIVVHKATGSVHLIKNPKKGSRVTTSDEYTVLREGPMSSKLGTTHPAGYWPNDEYTFVAVDR